MDSPYTGVQGLVQPKIMTTCVQGAPLSGRDTRLRSTCPWCVCRGGGGVWSQEGWICSRGMGGGVYGQW